MTTMNVSLPPELKEFVDAQVSSGGYGSTSEYVRALIRTARDREELRQAVLDGARSPVVGKMDEAYFGTLRASTTRR